MKLSPAFLPFLLAAPLFAQAPAQPPAQTPVQTAAPVPTALPAAPSSSEKPATPATPPADAANTIQARSNLVVLDVIVTDKSHNPVHGLKLSDFQVRDGGVPQSLKSADEHTPQTAKAAEPLPVVPPGVFTNFESAPADGPLNILLLDRLNTPLASQPFLHDQLVSFVRNMKPGTRVAIFGLNTHLLYLQGFTSDPKVLLAALESKRATARQSPLLGEANPGGAGSLSASMEQASATAPKIAGGPSSAVPPGVLADVQQFEVQAQSSQTQLRVRYTLEAMNDLARYLSGLSGRKNLIWFSGSFPLSILPDGDQPKPFAAAADLQDLFRDTTNLLARSQVAVYPVDVRGIQTPTTGDVSESGSRYSNSPTAFAKDTAKAVASISDEQTTMRQMASDTGGQAFINTNGLADAVTQAIASGSSYYTLAYTPTNTDYDGSFRKIQVSLERQGLQLSYRRGYYADLPGVKSQQGRKQLTASPLAPNTQLSSIRAAMKPGTPVPSQILIKAFVGPAGPPTDETVTENNNPPVDTKGPFRKYSVNYAVAPQDLKLTVAAPGVYATNLEFVVFVYDQNHALVNTIGQSIRARLTAENVRSIFKSGLQYQQVVSVPAHGEYFLRIAVRDLTADRIGAVEVPIDSVKDLPVVESPPPVRKAPTLTDLPK
ncbi:VWA domain-containing protein [Granulicella sibirica]|uniref:VWFA domain-containing protein n=1 Tax=Granulicella sibirica TaxID=2479048 RepID=A0A4Q0T195_9BACT|nr:VWA domain-containing protein [Granulicella sibirica]RXH55649.1 hypothetical protein GRAN_2506 [Granulicella sibirica]